MKRFFKEKSKLAITDWSKLALPTGVNHPNWIRRERERELRSRQIGGIDFSRVRLCCNAKRRLTPRRLSLSPSLSEKSQFASCLRYGCSAKLKRISRLKSQDFAMHEDLQQNLKRACGSAWMLNKHSILSFAYRPFVRKLAHWTVAL